MVFCLSDSKKITDASTNGKFMEVMTTLLGGKYCSTLQNVRDLKIKAVLEDCKGMVSKQNHFHCDNVSWLPSKNVWLYVLNETMFLYCWIEWLDN